MYNELFKRRPKHNKVNNINEMNTNINKNIIELYENANGVSKNISDVNNRHSINQISSFDTREVFLEDANKAYRLELTVATLKNGKKVAYAKKYLERDMKLEKKIKAATASQSRKNTTSIDIINQKPKKSNSPVKKSASDIVKKVDNGEVNFEESKMMMAGMNKNDIISKHKSDNSKEAISDS